MDEQPAALEVNGTLITNQGLKGVGRLKACSLDQFGETFGSVSALAIRDWRKTEHGYAGTFLTLPDRGFNMDGFFSDYAARLHSLAFTFVPVTEQTRFSRESKGSSGHRQNQIRVRYKTCSRFEFADGHRLTGLDSGNHSIRLLGAQLPFVVTQHLRGTTLSVDRVAVDAEGLAMKADGSGWFSEEYGPNIYRFDRDLRITRVIVPPEDYQPHDTSGALAFTSVADPVRGRRMNQGFEGLGLNASETRLFTLLQSALIQ